MNIGMILDSQYPVDPRVENEALTLIENGHTVHLFCVSYDIKGVEKENIKGIHVYRQGLPKYVYKLSALAYTITLYHKILKRKITDFLKEYKLDAIHIHDIQSARAVFNISSIDSYKTVLDLHENRPEIMKYYGHVNSFLGKLLIKPSIWQRYEDKYIKKAHHVIVVTEEAKDHYVHRLKLPDNKFVVVPNSVDRDFYTNYTVDESILKKYRKYTNLIYIGGTDERRGLETTIESISILKKRGKNIHFLIIGSSKYDFMLKKLVNQLKLQNLVHFEGWQSPDKFQSYILASDIGICPIHKNLHHDTTYANKVFQYLSFGLPVISSNCKAHESIINKYDCGLIFEQKDAEDLSGKIETLISDKKLYQRMSENASSAVKNHLNWSILSLPLVELYKNYEKARHRQEL